ncbi:MAG: hypothetical protein AAFX79_13490 [Planctomycetota bacterium]
MARITGSKLSISVDVANAIVQLETRVEFSEFDRRTELLYELGHALYGDDTHVRPADRWAFGDDPIDDDIGSVRFTAEGDTERWIPFVIKVPLSKLDEDRPRNSPDDIRARLKLTPQLPQVHTFESNLAQLEAGRTS